jgi:hypothetical protein
MSPKTLGASYVYINNTPLFGRREQYDVHNGLPAKLIRC